jgi:hypothetical protein
VKIIGFAGEQEMLVINHALAASGKIIGFAGKQEMLVNTPHIGGIGRTPAKSRKT